MLTKTIKYTDYNDVEREETYRFNLSKAELMDMQLTTVGGLDELIKKIIATKDIPSMTKFFKELVLKSYGVKSDDGKRFIKNDQLREEFEQTEAFTELYMELLTNDEAAAAFVKGIIPSDLAKQLNANTNATVSELVK